jgi:ABC-type polysaccharide/polyol phosphate export permease
VEAQASSPHTIEPLKRWPLPDLRDLAEHRDLLFLLARRDVAVRYKQSVAGVLWALLQPLLLAAVFAVFFSIPIGGGQVRTRESLSAVADWSATPYLPAQ